MSWYVLRTKPQYEIKSAQGLEKLGVEVFCPTVEEIRPWSDRKKKLTVPLFKSYLFVKLKPKDHNLIFEIPGILNYVYWLRKPAIARDEEIDAIKAIIKEPDKNKLKLILPDIGWILTTKLNEVL